MKRFFVWAPALAILAIALAAAGVLPNGRMVPAADVQAADNSY